MKGITSVEAKIRLSRKSINLQKVVLNSITKDGAGGNGVKKLESQIGILNWIVQTIIQNVGINESLFYKLIIKNNLKGSQSV